MAAHRRAFIIRIWKRDDGQILGQLNDPEQGGSYPFKSASELWQMLVVQVISPSRLELSNGDDLDSPIDSGQEKLT